MSEPLITDIGGYDLPEEYGPYVLWRFSSGDELLTDPIVVQNRLDLLKVLGYPAIDAAAGFYIEGIEEE